MKTTKRLTAGSTERVKDRYTELEESSATLASQVQELLTRCQNLRVRLIGDMDSDPKPSDEGGRMVQHGQLGAVQYNLISARLLVGNLHEELTLLGA